MFTHVTDKPSHNSVVTELSRIHTRSSSEVSQYKQKKLSLTEYKHFLNTKLSSLTTEKGKCHKSRKEVKQLDKVMQEAWGEKVLAGGTAQGREPMPIRSACHSSGQGVQGWKVERCLWFMSTWERANLRNQNNLGVLKNTQHILKEMGKVLCKQLWGEQRYI